jgi:glutamate N-acetyltransferase/amino-acid N-acetyltransferase
MTEKTNLRAATRSLLPVDLPRGFRYAATACGLKKHKRLDFALIASEGPAAAAGVFTMNLVQAAPVVVSREHLRAAAARIRAVIVNSGNANCATGEAGLAAARLTAVATALALGCLPEQVLVCSTGVIGVPLRIARILRAVPALARAQAATPAAFAAVSRAIMTTDTHSKWAAASCRIRGKKVRLLGCAKGAGMIHPQMATMIAFVLTDANARSSVLQRALAEVVRRTFNAISVDGDTSTNDSILLLASGASGAPLIQQAPSRGVRFKGRELQPVRLRGRSFSFDTRTSQMERASAPEVSDYSHFVAALEKVCCSLALAIVGDGEGATHLIEIEVRGAPSDRAAEQVARTIATSPLVKTALAGADPNWGRILAAAGRAGVPFDPTRVEIRLAGMLVCRRGRAHLFNERGAHRRLLRHYVPMVMDLRSGQGRARVWTCDLTANYVRINASYRT